MLIMLIMLTKESKVQKKIFRGKVQSRRRRLLRIQFTTVRQSLAGEALVIVIRRWRRKKTRKKQLRKMPNMRKLTAAWGGEVQGSTMKTTTLARTAFIKIFSSNQKRMRRKAKMGSKGTRAWGLLVELTRRTMTRNPITKRCLRSSETGSSREKMRSKEKPCSPPRNGDLLLISWGAWKRRLQYHK